VPKDDTRLELTPTLILRAYAAGVFPMADGAETEGVFWVEPRQRGVFPLDVFHVPRRLARTVRSDRFTITIDRDFEAVIDACADRDETWINGDIRRLYVALHRMGYAHSVETRRDGRLVGGLYGVRMGAAFFGESMFHRETDASKVALVHLVGRLKAGGFTLLDSQFTTDHLARFGAVSIPRDQYRAELDAALRKPADFFALGQDASGADALHWSSQTS
jgi:leucyl/phenylalanyl-tRNA--protein transferase